MAIKIVIIVLVMTFVLNRNFRENNPEKPTAAAPKSVKTDSTSADPYFSTAVFADKMQPAVFLIIQ